jgi:serine/threonine protein kinase
VGQQDHINEDDAPTQTYLRPAPKRSPDAETFTAARTEAIAPPRPLPIIPGYSIDRELGHGGMGEVYLARDPDGHTFALKMIRGDRVGTIYLERFLREKSALLELYHPNVVRIYYAGKTDDGNPYFTMPYYERGTLADRIEEFQSDPRKAVTLMIKVAEAVHYLHEHGRIHRDLKPQNILLGDNDEPYVSDFGLVKDLDALMSGESAADYWAAPSTDDVLSRAETRLNATVGNRLTAGVVGTMPYMSPEQLLRDKEKIGPQSDIWALGVILYELVCGARPFEAATPEVVSQLIRQEPPDRPAKVKPGIDAGLEHIILKCLAKKPEERYAGARAFADDLRKWLAPTRMRLKRPRKLTALAGVLSALFVAGLIWAIVHWSRPKAADPVTLEQARNQVREKLRTGEKAVFIGAKGEPLIPLNIIVAEGAKPDYRSKEGYWAIDTFGTVFVEFMDDPGVDTFVFTIQMRQERRNDMGAIGIYFADQQYKHANGDGHYYGLLSFAENTRPAVNDPQKTCRCEGQLRYFGLRADRPDFHKTLVMDPKPWDFPGKPEGGADSWRTLTIVASPEGYDMYFEGVLIGRMPRAVAPNWRNAIRSTWSIALPDDFEFGPRKPFGVFISRASATIRLAEISRDRNP